MDTPRATGIKVSVTGASGIYGLPRNLVASLALLGLYLVAAKLVSFVRVILSLFVLPGTSVSHFSCADFGNLLTDPTYSFESSAPKEAGPSSPAPRTASARNSPSSSRRKASTSSSSPGPTRNCRPSPRRSRPNMPAPRCRPDSSPWTSPPTTTPTTRG